MFLKFFICILGLSSFFTTKSLAVQAGEVFWEVKKPGTNQPPNYLIGTKHDMILNEESLPPELISVLENARTGLFEVVAADFNDEKAIELTQKMSKLPVGKTLSFYLGEENTQRIFEAIQFALNQLEDSFLADIVDEYKRNFDLDIRSYKDFNQVKPFFVFLITQRLEGIVRDQNNLEGVETKNPDEYTEAAPSPPLPPIEDEEDMDFSQEEPVVDIEECFLQIEPMDIYFQDVLSCMRKSIHSLETLETQLFVFSDAIIDNHELIANHLSRNMDMIVKLFTDRISATEDAVYTARLFLDQIMVNLMQIIMSNYHQGITIESDVIELGIQQEISNFFRNNNQCSTFPQSSIDEFVVKTANFLDLFLKQFVSGKQIEAEKEQEFVNLIREILHSQKEIVSLCFADYISSGSEETIRNEERLRLNMLKTMIESGLISRDQKMVENMLPYFEEGGAFAAVGLAHLSGILEELKAQGYEVKLIEFSTPLTEASGFNEPNIIEGSIPGELSKPPMDTENLEGPPL